MLAPFLGPDQPGFIISVLKQQVADQGFNHFDKADRIPVDRPLKDARPDDYDALMLPGGVINPDLLRLSSDAIGFIHHFVQAEKPIAAICHGPWSLVEADLVRGKTLTSWPSLQTDIRNAGGEWRDVESFTCPERFPLVTSRKPDDLNAFVGAALTAFAAA